MNQKKGAVVRQMDKCRERIERAFEIVDELNFEGMHDDNIQQIKRELITQVLNDLQSKTNEEQKVQSISVGESKKILENMDKLTQLLGQLNPYFTDPKYFQFETNERSVRQTQQKMLAMWEQVKQNQKERFSKYTDDKTEISDENLKDYEYTLHYQQGTLKKTIQVKMHDVLKLNPPNYLNDSIINFYLKFIETELIDKDSKVYIFNTYFMERLCPYDKLQNIQQSDNTKLNELFKNCYENIKRWVKEDLFEKDYLLFPLNLPEHWSLLIVYKPHLIFTNGASIIYLDSFGIMDQKLITIIKMYLHKVYSEKNTSDLSFNESPIKTVPSYQLLVPRQVNYVDCGVFLLEYAESFLTNPSYLMEQIDQIEGLNKLKLFPRTLVNRKRMLIKQLMIDITLLSKDVAILNYQKNRNQIIEECATNEDEYDQIDNDLFKEFLNQKNITNPTPEQYRSMILDFYMNPQQNYYHIEPHN